MGMYIYAISFTVGLNGLQVDHVNIEKAIVELQLVVYTQLVASKLVTACEHIQ